MTSDSVPSSSSRTSSGPWQPPALEEIQALFPQYEIVALLGRGGMGAVYKGWQHSLDRFVAIKILPQGLTDDPQYSERFKQEAKSMAKLAHAGIVAVFDAGELANGMLYFVMEFIEGTDVQKMIAEQGSLPPAHAMAITAHVCDALQYAHDRSIIHRDIKPANIMVGYDGVVKVADFGLAKQQQEGVSGLTQSGMVMGTLHYMAPESLILGVSVDHRADIYAVGIMLYQMLTGRLPQGLFEMPSQKVPGLDPRYDAVVAKAIREDRDIRYQSAAELRADLDSILTQPVVKVDPAATRAPAALPTVARPQRPQGYVQPVPKKSSFTGILLVAVLVLAAGGFFVFKDKLLPAPAPTQPVTAETSKTDPATPAPSAEETVKKDAAATTPVPATAKPASMPVAVPKTESVTSKLVAPQTDLEKRIASLETGFQNAAKAEPEQVFQQGMAALNKSYLAALDRSLATATQKGELDDAVALREEKQRMEKGSAVPGLLEEAATTVPVRDAVKKLRETYRTTQQQHATAKAKAVAALYDKYDLALAALQADLTKAHKLDDALLVKPLREQIKARKEAALAQKPIAAISLTSLGITNSLGMRLVPVPGTEVLMCVHETRRQDFAVFAQETSHGDNAWKDARAKGHATASGHEDGHPVVGVTWEQAVAFCEWLSKREGLAYRLPSDWEWSMAAGLSEPQSAPPDRTPKSFSGSTPDRYPWGSAWPPPSRAGNFLDLACWKDMAVPDFDKPEYDDGFPTTAPVMSFPPNSLGIFDLAGNVTEWCADWYDAGKTEHVSRGSAWYRKVDRGLLGASFREHSKVGFRNNGTGFRLVVKSPAAATPAASSVAAAVPAPASVQATVAASPTANAAAPQALPFTNSLGMKFVPVPGTRVLMCVHETRRQDYAAYADKEAGVSGDWKNKARNGIPVGHEDNHPVVGVSWEEADAFCAWLGRKEGRSYRLPTDREWSVAVGIGDQEDADAPAMVLSDRLRGLYHWGTTWPPPARSGNYADLSCRKIFESVGGVEKFIDGYEDGFPTTAPVMSFAPNGLGLYDLGGNVWEITSTFLDVAGKDRGLRGGSWDNPDSLIRSARRIGYRSGYRSDYAGFRVVAESGAASMVAASPTANAAAPQALPFTNSLGMKFVPVPGTQVLMCVHEARRQDYAAYAAETPGVDDFWRSQIRDGVVFNNLDNHPVVNLSFNDAQAFCDWLSKKEGKVYRLPSDKEWSHAVGIGRMEEAAGDNTPEMLSGKLDDQFPWGGSFPPQTGNLDGNYSDETSKETYPGWQVIKGYKDGFANSAPVMSFRANSLGLYDLGGNAWEWVEDWYDKAHEWRCLRGASFYDYDFGKKMLHSSYRFPNKQTFRHNNFGFRPVLDLAPSPSRQVPAPAMPNAPDANRARAPVVEPLVSQAVFFAITGQVSVMGKDGSTNDAGRAEPPPQGAAVVTSVSAGGTVKTGPKSSAALALVGGGAVHLDADSEMIVSAANEGRPAVESLELRKGRLFIHIEAADLARMGRTHIQIKTPVAAIAVQGGKCYVEIGAAYETIGVFRGSVVITETQSGSKAVVKDEMTLAAKPGRLSPPQRLAMAQTAFRKVCDQIELVRTEMSLLPLDEVDEKTIEDLYFFTNNQDSSSDKFVSASPVNSPHSNASGTLLVIKQNNLANLRLRTIMYTPKIDMARFKQEIVAVEFGCRGDGITQLAPGLNGNDSDSGRFEIIPFGANYVYYLGRRIRMKAGAGNLGDWTNRIYPLYPPVIVSKMKFIRPSFYLYMREEDSYFVPGRQEYRLELTPLVVITRKQQP